MPRTLAWLTPDEVPTDTICRALVIPADSSIIAAVNGALLPLTYSENWEQFGEVTPEDMAAAMRVMFDDFVLSSGGECVDLSIATCEHVVSQNTNGGSTPNANTDGRIPFNQFLDHPSWIGLSSNVFTIQPGHYWFKMEHEANPASGVMWAWLKNETNYPTLQITGLNRLVSKDRTVICEGMLQPTDEFKFGFWFRSNANSVANTGFGNPKNLSGYDEHYGIVSILKLGDINQ